METQELRIGNFVEINNKVIVMDNRIFHAVIHGFIGFEPNPIPLTREWLLKFGFKIKKTSIPYVYCINQYLDDYVEITLDYYFLRLGHRKTEIKYVHQLQNLYFALTGKELILKKSNEIVKKPTSEECLGEKLFIDIPNTNVGDIVNPTEKLHVSDPTKVNHIPLFEDVFNSMVDKALHVDIGAKEKATFDIQQKWNEGFETPKTKLHINTDAFNNGESTKLFIDNNGWIKIDSEADLPKEKGLYFLVTRKTGLITIQHRTPQFNKSTLERFSHYQPIIKPELPIY